MIAKLNPLLSVLFSACVLAVGVALAWYFAGVAEARTVLLKGLGVAAAVVITTALAFLLALIWTPHRLDDEKQKKLDEIQGQIADDDAKRSIAEAVAKLAHEGAALNRICRTATEQKAWCDDYWEWHARVCAYLRTLELPDLVHFQLSGDNHGVKHLGQNDDALHQRNIRIMLASALRLMEISERYRPEGVRLPRSPLPASPASS